MNEVPKIKSTLDICQKKKEKYVSYTRQFLAFFKRVATQFATTQRETEKQTTHRDRGRNRERLGEMKSDADNNSSEAKKTWQTNMRENTWKHKPNGGATRWTKWPTVSRKLCFCVKHKFLHFSSRLMMILLLLLMMMMKTNDYTTANETQTQKRMRWEPEVEKEKTRVEGEDCRLQAAVDDAMRWAEMRWDRTSWDEAKAKDETRARIEDEIWASGNTKGERERGGERKRRRERLQARQL